MPPTEADIIFSRASVTLAKSQRLIASWLPPLSASEFASAKTDEEIESEEREMFAPVPELLGVGATVPKDGDMKREELSSNEKLRRQLLGREYKKIRAGKREGGDLEGTVPMGSKPRPADSKREASQDSEDEGGRSSLGKSKRKRQMERIDTKVSDEEANKATKAKMGLYPPSKRAVNYLDQVLAEKSRKKHKKNKNQKKRGSQD